MRSCMSSALCAQLIVSGYIMAVFKHQEETYGGTAPGQTPVRRKGSSQTQVGAAEGSSQTQVGILRAAVRPR